MAKTVLSPMKINGAPTTAISIGQTQTTDAFPIQGLYAVAVQFSWFSGTLPSGECTVQGSVDGTYWSTMTLSATLTVSGASGNQIADVALSGCAWIRGVYTRTSGTGSMTITISGNGF